MKAHCGLHAHKFIIVSRAGGRLQAIPPTLTTGTPPPVERVDIRNVGIGSSNLPGGSHLGGMAERLKAVVLKTTVGASPTYRGFESRSLRLIL